MYWLWYSIYVVGYWLQIGTDKLSRRVSKIAIAIAAFGIVRARRHPQWYAGEETHADDDGPTPTR